jgi:hypothetical protein
MHDIPLPYVSIAGNARGNRSAGVTIDIREGVKYQSSSRLVESRSPGRRSGRDVVRFLPAGRASRGNRAVAAALVLRSRQASLSSCLFQNKRF